MLVKRDTSGIKQAAQHKRLQTLARAEEGIQQLIRLGEPVTFATVADIANVSTSWLYNQPELVERITVMRSQQPKKQVTPTPIQTASSFPAQDKMIQSLRSQVKALKAEAQALTQQLEAFEEMTITPTKGSAGELQRMLSQALRDLEREKQKNRRLQAQVRELKSQLAPESHQVVATPEGEQFGDLKIEQGSPSIGKSVSALDLPDSSVLLSQPRLVELSPAVAKGLEEIQLKPNKGVRDAMAELTEEQVLAAIAAFKEQASKPGKIIQSKLAYFAGLLQRQAEPNEEEAQDKNAFSEWFDLAHALGLVLGSTTNQKGELVCFDKEGESYSFRDYWLQKYPIVELERRADELINL